MVRVSDSGYHHGTTIKEFRLLNAMTQEELAAHWPKASGSVGVLTRYIQDIEYGKKHIDDPGVLRQLAALLHIPLWCFGLSEYDPFYPNTIPGQGSSLYCETLDTVESFIQQIWNLRSASRLREAEKGIARLNHLFAHLHEHVPLSLRLEGRFQFLYAQLQRLNAVTSVEKRRYEEAIDIYEKMFKVARQTGDASLLALSLMSLGTEFERKGEKGMALSRLEEARDASFGASKHVVIFVHTYLARAYASVGDRLRFERAIHSARTMADGLKGSYGDGTQFVHGRMSSILAEKSYGFLELGEPQKTLAMRAEIQEQIRVDQDVRLETWIPLDWARAYHMLGQVEASVKEGRAFYRRAVAMRSPHAASQAKKLLSALDRDGYGRVPAVQDLRHEIQSSQNLEMFARI